VISWLTIKNPVPVPDEEAPEPAYSCPVSAPPLRQRTACG
jgi:hypothetical protein